MIGQIASGMTGVAGAATGKSAAGAGSETPFSGVLKDIVNETTALDQQAAKTTMGLLSGQGVDIHDAMIATQKASMAFELTLQIRNKAVGAYQQMMGMQF